MERKEAGNSGSSFLPCNIVKKKGSFFKQTHLATEKASFDVPV
jgi:hypothetical protein